MTDVGVVRDEAAATVSTDEMRARVLRSLRFGDELFHWATWLAAIFVLVLLGAIIGSLIVGSIPAWSKFGLGFLTTERWSVNREIFGAVSPMYGTVVSSLIALLIAVPVGLGIAVFLTELCPPALRRPVGVAIELLERTPLA